MASKGKRKKKMSLTVKRTKQIGLQIWICLGGICVDWNILKENGFNFVKEICYDMGWTTLASFDGRKCINLVRKFYQNIETFKHDRYTIVSYVKGKKLLVTFDLIKKVVGL